MEIDESDWPVNTSPRDHKPWEVLNVWDGGLYMYQQAAREIADARGWSDDRLTALLEDMAAAINNGKLTTHDRKTGMARPLNRPEFFGLVTPESVNKWLASTQAIYQWTPQAPTAQAATAPPDAPVVDVPASEPCAAVGLPDAVVVVQKAKRETPMAMALPYLREVYHAGKFRTAQVFINSLASKSGLDGSPFKKASTTDDAFYLIENGKTIPHATLKNQMEKVRKKS